MDVRAGRVVDRCRVRQRVATAAAAGAQDRAAEREQPAVAAAYLEKVRLHAYRVTDGDVEVLLASGLSEDEVRNMAKLGVLPHFRHGRRLLFSVAALAAWVEAQVAA